MRSLLGSGGETGMKRGKLEVLKHKWPTLIRRRPLILLVGPVGLEPTTKGL